MYGPGGKNPKRSNQQLGIRAISLGTGIVVTCSQSIDMPGKTKINVANETLEAKYLACGEEAFYITPRQRI
jgi:hypothetical protein